MVHVAGDFVTRLRSYVRKRVRSSADADDVVQTVLLRLVENGEGPERGTPVSWVLATARTAVADLYRAQARRVTSIEDEVEAISAEEKPEIIRCIAPLLSALNPGDRTLLERIDMAGERQAAVALELGLSLTAMKSRVQRARSRLRKALLEQCAVERDRFGIPAGPASCRRDPGDNPCGCRSSEPC